MLTEQNIEQYLFDYHEGTLDASQKVELMDFLHQHPEWQRDFAIWAQVRLHDESVAAPALQKKIGKSIASQFPLWYSGLLAGVTMGIGAALLVWYLAGTTHPVTPGSPRKALPAVLQSQSANPLEEKEPLAKKEEVGLPIEIEQKEYLFPKNENTEETPAIKEANLSPAPLPKEAFVPTDTAQVPVSKVEEPKLISSVPDSSKEDPEEPSPEAAPKKKKKRPKQKISLKPTSDIIPSNSNF